MGVPAGLDLDLLRSFVAIAEEGSFTRAAERVGRTQSAVSLQMQGLEGVLGQIVIVRGKGGSVELNQQGRYLLDRARELLALNDDVMRSMRAAPCTGPYGWVSPPSSPSSICRRFSIASRRSLRRSRSRSRSPSPACSP